MIAPTSFFLDYGCHVRILEEARVLTSLGHCVKIVTYPIGRDLPGLDIERTIPVPVHTRKEVGPSRSKILIDPLLALKALQAALAFKPNVIHAHLHEGALIGGILSRLLRIPLVFDFQGSMTSEMIDHRFVSPRGVIVPLVRRIEWLIDRLPRTILTSSQNAAHLLVDEFQVPASKLLVLSDCVNADAFGPVGDASRAIEVRDLQAQLNIPEGRKI
ncbi:MAG: glycosyltransferase, partial [Chloroflexi bacterium]|nr:glycosyltransferase [Chloroflexota bacterium]